MQQQKRRSIFRAGLPVDDGEPVYLDRAIKSRVFHQAFPERTSHRQNDAELRFAAQHARVRLGRSFERIGFNHRTDAG